MTRPPADPARFEPLQVLDALIEGFQVIDRSWRYVYVNPSAASHGRTQAEDLVGRTMQACYPGIEDTEMFAVLEQCMRDRTPRELVNEFTYPDGRTGWFQLRCQPVPVGIAVLSIDITEQREARAQLRRAQRLDALGQLAGGIAHDFNNLLTVIQGNAELALEALPSDGEGGADLAAITHATERARHLTRQLRACSSNPQVATRPCDLGAVVRHVEAMLGRVLSEQIELETHLAGDLPAVRIDPGTFDQVLLNLVINARDALPDGGRVTIDTAHTTLDRGHPAACGLEIPPGDYVVLAVSDTGPGLPPEVADRVFEPFFTTRETGTGLGLSTCFGIVRQANGYMWLYSEPDHGTTFKVYLPPCDQPAEPVVATPPRPPAGPGCERILIVEDQAALGATITRALVDRGYAVTTATTTAEALRRLRADPPYDLLLTDLVLPDGSGLDLLPHLRRERGDLPVVVMSGYAPSRVLDDEAFPEDSLLLEKPFSMDGLRRTVRQALDGRAGSG